MMAHKDRNDQQKQNGQTKMKMANNDKQRQVKTNNDKQRKTTKIKQIK